MKRSSADDRIMRRLTGAQRAAAVSRALFTGAALAVACAAHAAQADDASMPAQTPAPSGITDAPRGKSPYDAQWFDAARMGRLDILQLLIDARQPLDGKNGGGYTALMLSAYHGHRDAVALLLKNGADACVADSRGNTALMGAIFQGELDAARALLDSPCDLNYANASGATAIVFAVLFGRIDFVPELLAHGADVNFTDPRGTTALNVAQSQGNARAVEALKRYGAKY